MSEIKQCSAEGCLRRVAARDMCIMHYQKAWRAGEIVKHVGGRGYMRRLVDIEAQLTRVEAQLAELLAKESA